VVLSEEFADSADAKLQRPLEWCVAAVRALGIQQDPAMHDDGSGVVRMLAVLGQVPFGWLLPDGYPDRASAWASTAGLLARWNTAQQLVAGEVPGLRPLDVDALVGTPVPTTVGGLVDRLCARLLGRSARPALRSALVRSTGKPATAKVDQSQVRVLAPRLAALILSSPEAQVR